MTAADETGVFQSTFCVGKPHHVIPVYHARYPDNSTVVGRYSNTFFTVLMIAKLPSAFRGGLDFSENDDVNELLVMAPDGRIGWILSNSVDPV